MRERASFLTRYTYRIIYRQNKNKRNAKHKITQNIEKKKEMGLTTPVTPMQSVQRVHKSRNIRSQLLAQNDLIRRMTVQHRQYVRRYRKLLKDRDEEIVATIRRCREIVDHALKVQHVGASISVRFGSGVNLASRGLSPPPFSSTVSLPTTVKPFQSNVSSSSLESLSSSSSSSPAISFILLFGLVVRLISAIFVFSWFFVKDRIRTLLVDHPILYRLLWFISVTVETVSLFLSLLLMWFVSQVLGFLFRCTR